MTRDPTLEVCPITFDEAIQLTAGKPRHLLLGNGFSIDARPAQFTYSTLYSRAGEFSADVAELFRRNSYDFESVLEAISAELNCGDIDEVRAETLRAQEREIHDGFTRALSSVHPDSSHNLSLEERRNCAEFLRHFVGKQLSQRALGKVFTTNYDLLLYWAIVQNGKSLNCHDAYIRPHAKAHYREWHPEKYARVLYLHGALHLYEHRDKQLMLCWDGEQTLIQRTRHYLEQGRFPLIVAEGTTGKKLARILRSEYLQAARKSLNYALKDQTAALFTLGHGLAERDAHFLERVGELRIGSVFIGAYGGVESDDGRAAQKWARRWWAQRRAAKTFYPLQVFVFDSKTFSPWRGAPGARVALAA